MSATDRGHAARQEHMRRSALRAMDDPKQLDRAVRIVRAAIDHNRLTLDLRPADLETIDAAVKAATVEATAAFLDLGDDAA